MKNQNPAVNDPLILYAPVSGVIMPIETVPDPAFSGKMVGDGIAMDPASEVLLAPCGGTVTHSLPHALTLTTPEGVDVLLHIGLDTVQLKGAGFSAKVQKGDTVRTGDPLIAFDAAFLADHAVSLLTEIIIPSGHPIVFKAVAKTVAEAGKTPILRIQTEKAAGTATETSAAGHAALSSSPLVVLNPAGLHARPAATLANSAKQFSSAIELVKGEKRTNAKSVVGIMSLDVQCHDRVVLSASGPDAAQAIESLGALIISGLGENIHTAPPPSPDPVKPSSRPKSDNPDVLMGVSASPGLAIGRIFQLRHEVIAVSETGGSVEAETRALLDALAAGKKELADLQQSLRSRADPGKAAIFAAHQELLEDPALLSAAREGIACGQSAAFAWQAAFTAQAKALAGLNNELLAGRANDVRDIGRRVLLHLTDSAPSAVSMPENTILVAEDLTPSDTAGLDTARVLGFCTTGGSATSHASILARAAGIPAVAAVEDRALDLPDGTLVILDGEKGEIFLSPSEENIATVTALQEKASSAHRLALADAQKPAVTVDGHRIKVVGNIGGAAESDKIAELGGEGVGLLRSEFLFLQRMEAPSEEEQAAAYITIAKTLGPDRDFVVRTLDVGGDKPLAYLPLPAEVNPFLGIRGIRLNTLGTDLFVSQIRAALQAAPYSRLHIMFPMVADMEELKSAKALVLQEKKALGITAPVQIGVMIEVPSAAVMAAELAREADFFSIGTNDLTQYTLAIDRGHPKLAKMADALHPAVLRLIQMTVKGAHDHGRWVGVCGGIASDTLAVPVLMGLGVDELSVSVGAIPAVKAAVRRASIADCRALLTEILRLETAAAVRRRLSAYQAEQPAQPVEAMEGGV